jgi:uncharacterized protein (DUF305 family)
MILFSRAFIRKRMISLAATASVTATSFAFAEDPTRTDHLHGAMPIQDVADMTIKPTGDVDRDFVEMMVPHHQGAVDMARAELKYGQNEQLRPLAQEIVAKQQQEIKVMRDAGADGQSSATRWPDEPNAQLSTPSAPIDGSIASGGMKMFR